MLVLPYFFVWFSLTGSVADLKNLTTYSKYLKLLRYVIGQNDARKNVRHFREILCGYIKKLLLR